ncbi:hypothetical protein [Spirosoma spitsbergense]|uniref:hypothetical protein n=1 Tax=Spirosoma spitsbergense TaxID=431554 RepID=UPI0012F98931|nr:hypothetical protein [Spirosoma spitsbergense]
MDWKEGPQVRLYASNVTGRFLISYPPGTNVSKNCPKGVFYLPECLSGQNGFSEAHFYQVTILVFVGEDAVELAGEEFYELRTKSRSFWMLAGLFANAIVANLKQKVVGIRLGKADGHGSPRHGYFIIPQ